jgi:hypothetical protein
VARRPKRQLLSKIAKIPAGQRLEALRLEMGGVELKERLSPEQWLRNRIRIYWLLAFLALCVVGVVVFVIARVEATKSQVNLIKGCACTRCPSARTDGPGSVRVRGRPGCERGGPLFGPRRARPCRS